MGWITDLLNGGSDTTHVQSESEAMADKRNPRGSNPKR